MQEGLELKISVSRYLGTLKILLIENQKLFFHSFTTRLCRQQMFLKCSSREEKTGKDNCRRPAKIVDVIQGPVL
jgi:hypothetical protein